MYERGHNVFNVGDVILYTTRGVCRIDDKIVKQLGGRIGHSTAKKFFLQKIFPKIPPMF